MRYLCPTYFLVLFYRLYVTIADSTKASVDLAKCGFASHNALPPDCFLLPARCGTVSLCYSLHKFPYMATIKRLGDLSWTPECYLLWTFECSNTLEYFLLYYLGSPTVWCKVD